MTSVMTQLIFVIFLLIFLKIKCDDNYNLATFTHGDKGERKMRFLADLITVNLKRNGWSNIIYAGRNFPDYFYVKMQSLRLTFTTSHPDMYDVEITDVTPSHTNTVILNCMDFDEFESALRKVMASPYWHPHANTILYYHSKGQKDIPNIFIVFWFYSVSNGIVVQYNDDEERFLVSVYNPYVGENYKLPYHYGCWKTTKIGRAVKTFNESFACEEGCQNVAIHSKRRDFFLGTCIGYDIISIRYGNADTLPVVSLFEDKGKNLHGFVLKAHGGVSPPFMVIRELGNDTYALEARDGMIWRTISDLMNFTINLDAVKKTLRQPFDFNVNVQLIYSFARKQADIVLFPIYQFDLIIVDLDLSIAYKDSGVCIMSHRAGFETVLFDFKLLTSNIELVMRFSVCFLLIWLLFFVFNTFETGKLSFDQAGKDLVNTIRNVLSISLHNPPRRGAFRIYLFVSMWGFFIMNFATQAAIISFFSVYKRGKEVETFEDILEKGYNLEGMASPDMFLPDDEERFVKFNSRIIPMPSMYSCLEKMSNDSHRFCLIDCAQGRYVKRNKLNEKGEQFLHIAKDRVHSHYLNMILHKHSPLTKTFNKLLRTFFEAGLILKWEQYRFSDITDEVPIKALKLEDLIGIFKCFYIAMGMASAVFVTELFIGFIKREGKKFLEKIVKWKRAHSAEKQLKAGRKLGNI